MTADPAVVALLEDRQFPLGICPSSNLLLKVYPSLAEHPIEREYALCADAFGWDDQVLRDVARTSIEASFAEPSLKQELLGRLARWGGR